MTIINILSKKKSQNYLFGSLFIPNQSIVILGSIELKEHNYYRSLHGCPPLILNEDLNVLA